MHESAGTIWTNTLSGERAWHAEMKRGLQAVCWGPDSLSSCVTFTAGFISRLHFPHWETGLFIALPVAMWPVPPGATGELLCKTWHKLAFSEQDSCSLHQVVPTTLEANGFGFMGQILNSSWLLPRGPKCVVSPHGSNSIISGCPGSWGAQSLSWEIPASLSWSFADTSSTLWASLVAQTVKNLPAMPETQVWSQGREDPLEKGAETHSSLLA